MDLAEFIDSNPDPRELKRALAVNMREQGFKHSQISSILRVQSSYISRWGKKYEKEGVDGLRLAYQGSKGLLSVTQRQEVIDWLSCQRQINLWELIEHIDKQYHVTYASSQSYYDLLKAGGMSWHQGEKKIPNTTQTLWSKGIKR